MPYIPQKDREASPFIDEPTAETAGELNYLVSRAASRFIGLKGASYQTFHDAVGALRDAAVEIERRFVGPYEESKRQQNGEVFKEIVDALRGK